MPREIAYGLYTVVKRFRFNGEEKRRTVCKSRREADLSPGSRRTIASFSRISTSSKRSSLDDPIPSSDGFRSD